MLITIVQLEAAINQANRIQPPVDYVVSPDVSAMAEVYGHMIMEKPSSIDVDQLPEHTRNAIIRHLQTTICQKQH